MVNSVPVLNHGEWQCRQQWLTAQSFEQMVHGFATALNPVCGPIEIPLVLFLPCGRQIPDVLRSAPVTYAGGCVLCGCAGCLQSGEISRRICGQRMPVAVLPLNVIRQTAPVGAGDFRFWIGFLGRSGKRFIDEIRRHGGAQPESGLIRTRTGTAPARAVQPPVQSNFCFLNSIESRYPVRRRTVVVTDEAPESRGTLFDAVDPHGPHAKRPPRSCNCDANSGTHRICTYAVATPVQPHVIAGKRLE